MLPVKLSIESSGFIISSRIGRLSRQHIPGEIIPLAAVPPTKWAQAARKNSRLKAAKALGLTVPLILLGRAEEVIE